MKLPPYQASPSQAERMAYLSWRFRRAIVAEADEVHNSIWLLRRKISSSYASTRFVAASMLRHGRPYFWALMQEQSGLLYMGPYTPSIWRWAVENAFDSHQRAPWIDIPF